MTRIIFADRLPDGAGACADYRHEPVVAIGWQWWDVRPVIAGHLDEWMQQLEQWHRRLCHRGGRVSPWWWTLRGSRLTAWYPIDLTPLWFTLATIARLQRERPPVICLLRCPAAVETLLREWSAGSGGPVQIEVATPPRRTESRPDRHGGKETASFVARRVRHGVHRDMPRARLLVVSQTLNAAVMADVGDHYLGRIVDQALPGDAVWLYQLSAFSDGARVARLCEALGRPVRFEFEPLTWGDVAASAMTAVRARRDARTAFRAHEPLDVGGLRTSAFPEMFFRTTLQHAPVTEVALYRAVRRALVTTGASAVLYPWEEKGAERAILMAAREQAQPVRAIAFGHAAYIRGHLYAHWDAGRPQPDVIATTGPAASEQLARWGVPAGRLAVIGSNRYREARPLRAAFGQSALRVLLLQTGVGAELRRLAQFADATPDLFAGCELIVRPYPYGDIEDQRADQARLERIPGIRFESGPFADQVADVDVVLFSSTSAAVEASLLGRVAVHVGLQDIDTGHPLEAAVAAGEVASCASGSDLARVLRELASLSRDQFTAVAIRQRRHSAGIYAPPDPHALADLVQVGSEGALRSCV